MEKILTALFTKPPAPWLPAVPKKAAGRNDPQGPLPH